MIKNKETWRLGLCAIACCIVLGAQVAAWATTVCYVPNVSTVFCTKSITTGTCGESLNSTLCGAQVNAVTRNQFPNGVVLASSGATKEVSADCYQTKGCHWIIGMVSPHCVVNTNWNPWVPGDKTVVDPGASCPTDEG